MVSQIGHQILTCKAHGTGTVVVVDQINASSTIEALTDTIIDILVTVFASPTRPAFALIISF